MYEPSASVLPVAKVPPLDGSALTQTPFSGVAVPEPPYTWPLIDVPAVILMSAVAAWLVDNVSADPYWLARSSRALPAQSLADTT